MGVKLPSNLYSGDTVTTRSGWAGAHWGARLGSTVDAPIWYSRRDYRHSPQQETEWGPLVDVRYLLSDWAALDGAASWRNLVIEEEGLEDIEDDVLRLAGGLVLLLGSLLQLEAGVGYLTVDSSDPSRSYSTTRAFALMTVFFRPLAPGRFPRSFASRFMEASTPTARGAGIYAVDETQAGGR